MSFFREPIVHFGILGCALFALHRAVTPRGTVEVTPKIVEGLGRDHERRTRAVPSDDERRKLIDRYVDGELLYREALALGLDRGDTIVRRRLVQKMQFVLESDADGAEPRDDELQALLPRFAQPARISFTHKFMGDGDSELPFPRGRVFSTVSELEIAAAFGAPFARGVMALPDGEWSAVQSSFGRHLVRVDAREASAPASLDDVRARATAEWREARRAQALRDGIARLRQKYRVRTP